MNNYSIKVDFKTDRPITEEELGALMLQVIAQIEEPVTLEGDDVDYQTTIIGEDK
jgi:hypothetical protein